MTISETSRLIKADAMRQSGPRGTFHLDDLRRQCEEHVAAARRHGEEVVAQAVAEADEIRRRAYEEGHAAGQSFGLAASRGVVESRAVDLARVQTEERLHTVLPALEAVANSLAAERDRWLAEWETSAVRLSAAIAGKIVRREVARDPDLTVEIVRAALRMAAGSPQVDIRLNPQDLERLQADGAIADCLSRIGETVFTADEGVSRGGCLIETRQGRIDARIETQLARIVDELLGTSS